MSNVEKVSGKVIVVTGGANGIGLAIVENFIRKGAKTVVILDLNSNTGSKVSAELNTKYGTGKTTFIQCDVTNDKNVDNILRNIIEKVKTIDVFVNNAGVINEVDTRKCIDINLTSLINWSVTLWNYMRKDKSGAGGTIINIASLYGVIITPFVPTYHATKHGVYAFSKSLGHSFNYKRTGVRVIALCPGFTHTSLLNGPSLMDEELAAAWDKESKIWQETDAVGAAAVEVFENSASGLAWQILGNKPIVEV